MFAMPFSRLCTNTATLGTRTEVEIGDCHFAFNDPLDPGLIPPVLTRRLLRKTAPCVFEARFL